MKVLLKKPETGQFYAGPDTWTADATLAHDFKATDRALDEVPERNPEALQVVMLFEDPSFEIPLSIAGLGT